MLRFSYYLPDNLVHNLPTNHTLRPDFSPHANAASSPFRTIAVHMCQFRTGPLIATSDPRVLRRNSKDFKLPPRFQAQFLASILALAYRPVLQHLYARCYRLTHGTLSGSLSLTHLRGAAMESGRRRSCCRPDNTSIGSWWMGWAR